MSSLAVGRGTTIQQLQSFMDANAGKEIRAKEDDKGNVTLYARSNWKPSLRYFREKGDMSGRTAKQDLARSTITNVMTRQGVSPKLAAGLMRSCGSGGLQATSSQGTGIWVGGHGFNFPGMGSKSGLDRQLTKAERYAKPFIEQLKDPVHGPKIRADFQEARTPEISNCLDSLNTMGKEASGCSDQQMRTFVTRFMGNPEDPESINDNLMGVNTTTSGISGFKREVGEWDAMPPGQERDAAKQKLLDTLHTTLVKGIDADIRQNILPRMQNYN